MGQVERLLRIGQRGAKRAVKPRLDGLIAQKIGEAFQKARPVGFQFKYLAIPRSGRVGPAARLLQFGGFQERQEIVPIPFLFHKLPARIRSSNDGRCRSA